MCVVLGVFTLCALPHASHAAVRAMSLDGVVAMAKSDSRVAAQARDRYRSSLWQFRVQRASFLPTLALVGTAPDLTRSISKLSLPDGSEAFVRQSYNSSGLRLSELVGLNHGDLDRRAHVVRVRGKGRKERIVPVGDAALEALARYEAATAARSRAADAPLFLGRDGRLTGRTVQRVVRRRLAEVASGGDRAGRGTSATLEVTFEAKGSTEKMEGGVAPVHVVVGVRYPGGYVAVQDYTFEVKVP